MAKKGNTGLDSIILGTVESIDDPTYSGRIKVRVPGLHDNISTEELPWCTYGGSPFFSGNGGGSISIARVGQQVRVQFKSGEKTSMEWLANNQVDPDLINEIKDDYENAQVLLYDSAVDLSIKFQTGTGLILYYQGSFIQIMPDNTITIHYGLGATGTQIQLSKDRVDIQANKQINLTTSGTINLEADNIILNSKSSTQLKGDAAGEAAINGSALITLLTMIAGVIDSKVPAGPGMTASTVNSMKEAILNQHIQYI